MKQTDLCKYRNLRDELIHDRLVSGIRVDRTREKLLSRKEINLEKTIELVKASEATHRVRLKTRLPLVMKLVVWYKLSKEIISHTCDRAHPMDIQYGGYTEEKWENSIYLDPQHLNNLG